MKRISIIWKVTIWYTSFLCIMAIMVVSLTYFVSEKIITRISKNYLTYMVEEVAEEIEYEDGILEIDDDIDFLEQGVYLSIYDENNIMLLGIVPKYYDFELSYCEGVIETIDIGETEWYVYELTKIIRGFGTIKIRGMVATDFGVENHYIITRVLFVLSPLIILIATIGGYILTKQAFRPIDQMRKTVEQISGGHDLTRRVNLGQGKDELYRLANTFDQMFERLEQAFEREKQFTSDVSHELRTPVSVILSQCEYALEQENGIETENALKVIDSQIKRISKVIGQLLLLSRSDQAFVKLTLEEVQLSELVEVIVEEAKERARQKNIMITTNMEENLVLQADETMMVRFFMNLISNAISYGKENGFIKIELREENGKIVGSIEDNGIGIAKEEQDKVWKRFYQVDSSRKSTKEGNVGLGLSMVQWIAKAHGGEVRLQSELGVGSTFHFWFPVKEFSS